MIVPYPILFSYRILFFSFLFFSGWDAVSWIKAFYALCSAFKSAALTYLKDIYKYFYCCVFFFYSPSKKHFSLSLFLLFSQLNSIPLFLPLFPFDVLVAWRVLRLLYGNVFNKCIRSGNQFLFDLIDISFQCKIDWQQSIQLMVSFYLN